LIHPHNHHSPTFAPSISPLGPHLLRSFVKLYNVQHKNEHCALSRFHKNSIKTSSTTLTTTNTIMTITTHIQPYRVISSLSELSSEEREKSKLIGTHSGSFHCDEALACSLLSLLPDEFSPKSTILVRSRDAPTLSQCHILVDVGGEFNPETLRFDHHQKAFDDLEPTEKTLTSKDDDSKVYKTKLSSAGLIYKYYGKRILDRLMNETQQGEEKSQVLFSRDEIIGSMTREAYDQLLEDLYHRVYKNFMEHIDAIDNGIDVSDGEIKYRISTSLSSRVGRLNSNWNSSKEKQTSAHENAQFQKAMIMTGEDFLDVVNGYLDQWLPGRSIVMKTVQDRFNVDPSGKIIRFDQFCPWKDHLFVIEKELGIVGQIELALFADNSGAWRIQSVPIEGRDFDNRRPLPKEWRGLRDAELSEKSGISDCIFVHMGGFIGGNKTYEGALQMARETLRLTSSE